MKTEVRLLSVLVVVFAFTSFLFISSALAGSTSVTSDGIKFPDGTTQTTASSGGSGQWSTSGFDIYYNSGNVGIGTSSPSDKLEVAGNIEVSGAGNGVKFPDGTVQTTASAPTWHQILPAADRFQLVMNNAAVLDKETGLVWEKSPDTATSVWTSAISHCYMREVGGRKGWRLPAIEELASLVDTSVATAPYLPAGHPFINVQSSNYWSSSTIAHSTAKAWVVAFGNGNVHIGNGKSFPYYAWCVRGGYGHDAY
jgi:hypothetical protein